MSSVKKRPKFDILTRNKSMNRSLRVKDRKRRLHDQLHVGIQDKLEKEIKLRDGASRMLAACTHEDQLLEVAKTLHTSNARMYTYMSELQKLKTAEIMERVMNEEGTQNESKVCSGRIALSDIRIPLMWNDPERYSGVKTKEASRYAVFCLVRVGSEVQDTELVCTDKTTTDVCFRDVLVFEDASHNFKTEIEIYAFPMSEESISAPTPQKLLSRLNRSIGKSEGKRIRDRLKESPAANMKMGPQYEKLGSLVLDLTCVEDHIKSHDINHCASVHSTSARTKPLLPLYGNLTCRLVAQPRCITEKSNTGFLHFMEMVGGIPSWSYMWCEVKAGKLHCWMNPEDSAEKHPQNSISLIATDVRVNEIEKNRQKRPNSFQVRDLEDRHIFSADNKDDMTRWIKSLRQHRIDYSAWKIACGSLRNGDQPTPMFIASPSPYKAPSNLLFDSSVRKTLIYEQMSIDSPSKSESDRIEVSDLLRKGEGSVGVAMIGANQSTPWAGLFSGALNQPKTKVTKLKDVQNIEPAEKKTNKNSAKTPIKNSESSTGDSKKSSRKNKPPIPRRPSEDLVKERRKHCVMSPMSPTPPPRIESLKPYSTSGSCSETGLSDFYHSSDDVFLSSDENILKSPSSSATRKKPPHGSSGKVKAPSRGRKKRRAPMPPSSGQDGRQTDTQHSGVDPPPRRAGSKASLSSGSSLDDILDPRGRMTYYSSIQDAPKPSPRSRHRNNNGCLLNSDPEGRKSQISLASNSTQISNTSSGYKSDSEGLITQSSSPLLLRQKKMASKQTESTECEILITERDVRPKSYGRIGVKVLPMGDGHGTPNRPFTRSHSFDVESHLRSSGMPSEMTQSSSAPEDSSRGRFSSDPASNASRMENSSRQTAAGVGSRSSSKSDQLVMKMLSKKVAESPSGSKPSFPRPIPAPRRSYLTAVESTQVKTRKDPIYETPADLTDDELNPSTSRPPLCNTPKFAPQNGVENIYSEPTPKALRPPKHNVAREPEPIYAQVCKASANSGHRSGSGDGEPPAHVGVDPYVKAHKAIITVCKQRMEEENVKKSKSRVNSTDHDSVYI